MRVYTVGHSTSTLEQLVHLMDKAGVGTVVDVRSIPRSRMHQFDQAPLKRALESAGIEYRFMGDLLGGIPRDPGMRQRWHQGRLDPHVLSGLRASREWQQGVVKLSRLVGPNRDVGICILCSEREPSKCHRKAVALDLAEKIQGTEIVHLGVGKITRTDVGIQEALM